MVKQNRLLVFLHLCVIVFLTVACEQNSKSNIVSYYLPLDELYDGMAYEYRALNNDSLPPYYWYFRTVQQEQATFLTGMYYNYAFVPQQFIREEQVGNGMLLEEMFIYEPDSLDKQIQIPVTIQAASTYPFEVQDSLGVFLYKVGWSSFKDKSNTTITRNRRYKGEVTHQIGDESYECVEFEVRELVDNEKDGFLELELRGIERYAKGIGLIYTERYLVGGAFRQEYELFDRYPMTKLEAHFQKQLE